VLLTIVRVHAAFGVLSPLGGLTGFIFWTEGSKVMSKPQTGHR
jgi:hypothetical protein